MPKNNTPLTMEEITALYFRNGTWSWRDMPLDVYRRVDDYDFRNATISIGSTRTEYLGAGAEAKEEKERQQLDTENIRPVGSKAAYRLLGIFTNSPSNQYRNRSGKI